MVANDAMVHHTNAADEVWTSLSVTGPPIVCSFPAPMHDWTFQGPNGAQFGLVQWKSSQTMVHAGHASAEIPVGATGFVALLTVVIAASVLLRVLVLRMRRS